MNINEFLTHINQRKPVSSKSEIHEFMVKLSNEAMKITSKLNSSYHEPEEVRSLFSELIGKKVDESFFMFPPFYTDCGKNIDTWSYFIFFCIYHSRQVLHTSVINRIE